MAHRVWLSFHEPDGHVGIEILGSGDDFADLVDPNDGTVLHAGSFAMHGGEWRVESVTVTEDLIHIECISTAAQVPLNRRVSSSRSKSRRERAS